MFNHLWSHGPHDHHEHMRERLRGMRAHGGHWAGPRGPFGRHRGLRGAPPDWFGDFFGPPPRAERGGVRYLVLDVLAERERHGYEVIQAIEERSGGVYRPSPGVVYPTLQLLEELGHAKLTEVEGRKVYSITDDGRRDLEEHQDEIQDFYSRFDDAAWERQLEDFGDLMRQAGRLFKTFKRAARRGQLTPKVQTKIREVLNESVQRIEAILAEQDR
ncbi:MAG TPA: PadR family transcriptional regulator [Polyangiales bacterium]|nr:PadR family transcriptional regulator [Polyangiales bacterium]